MEQQYGNMLSTIKRKNLGTEKEEMDWHYDTTMGNLLWWQQTKSTTSSPPTPESDHCSHVEEVEDDGDDGDDEDEGVHGYDGDRGAELEADLSGKGNKAHVKHCFQCGQPVQQESVHFLCDENNF